MRRAAVVMLLLGSLLLGQSRRERIAATKPAPPSALFVYAPPPCPECPLGPLMAMIREDKVILSPGFTAEDVLLRIAQILRQQGKEGKP